jgi:hypothetical protein
MAMSQATWVAGWQSIYSASSPVLADTRAWQGGNNEDAAYAQWFMCRLAPATVLQLCFVLLN